MAYYPIIASVNADSIIYASLGNNDPVAMILVATGTTSNAATNQLTGGTAVMYAPVYFGAGDLNKFWINSTATSSTIYAAVGIIRPHCNYMKATTTTVNKATSSSSTPKTFNLNLSLASGTENLNRYITMGLAYRFQVYYGNAKNWQVSGCTAPAATGGPGLLPVGSAEAGYSRLRFADDGIDLSDERETKAYVPARCFYFKAGTQHANLLVTDPFLKSVYWSGNTATLINSHTSAISLSHFKLYVETTGGTSITIMELTGSPVQVGANSTTTATFTRGQSSPIFPAAANIALEVDWTKPSGYAGNVHVKDEKFIFDEEDSESIDALYQVMNNTSGGTWLIQFDNYSPGYTLRVTSVPKVYLVNNKNNPVQFMYVEFYGLNAGGTRTELFYISGNPTVPAYTGMTATTYVNNSVANNCVKLEIYVTGTYYASGTFNISASCSSPNLSVSQSFSGMNFTLSKTIDLTSGLTFNSSSTVSVVIG